MVCLTFSLFWVFCCFSFVLVSLSELLLARDSSSSWRIRVASRAGYFSPARLFFLRYCIYFRSMCFFAFAFYFFPFLFERSEFLIATCKKKKTDRLSVLMFG